SLSIDTPKLFFLRDKEARNNWTFKSDSVSKWEVHPGKLVIRKGSVQLDDAIRHIDATAEIATLDPDKEKVYGIGWHIKGSFNETGIHGAGKAGGVLSLQNDHRPYPLEADMRVGKTHIAVKGTLTKPQDLTVLDLRLNLSGDSMAHLFSLTGVLLPETPPFSTAGHLISKLAPGQSDWTYEKFNGKVGSSNISGTLEYQLKQPRPLLKGEIVSSLLQFEDLAPLIGVEERQSSNRMLPTGEFNTGNWNALDAEIKLTAHAIAKKKNLPITDIHAELQLNDQILSLALLNLGIAGGKLSSTIRLDGRAPEMKSELQLSARHLRIQQLLPGFDRTQIGFGEINGDAALSAAGNSLAAMLASSNGEFKALVNQGAISQLLLEELGLNPGDVMMSRLFGDRPVNLNCLTSNFTVSNGLMLARTFALDTEDALINITGNINLAQEQLHLTIDPRSKDLRTISLRSPLSVSGPFSHPDISVDKRAALQAGGAVLLGVAAPVTAILPLINVNAKQKIDCAGLLEEAQKRPTAG
ncbi:MAG TPA: AsmA family protein, partial [Herbaspirillum sp.]|nr:AsmA family protein [Herbaspirillum sp.]